MFKHNNHNDSNGFSSSSSEDEAAASPLFARNVQSLARPTLRHQSSAPLTTTLFQKPVYRSVAVEAQQPEPRRTELSLDDFAPVYGAGMGYNAALGKINPKQQERVMSFAQVIKGERKEEQGEQQEEELQKNQLKQRSTKQPREYEVAVSSYCDPHTTMSVANAFAQRPRLVVKAIRAALRALQNDFVVEAERPTRTSFKCKSWLGDSPRSVVWHVYLWRMPSRESQLVVEIQRRLGDSGVFWALYRAMLEHLTAAGVVVADEQTTSSAQNNAADNNNGDDLPAELAMPGLVPSRSSSTTSSVMSIEDRDELETLTQMAECDNAHLAEQAWNVLGECKVVGHDDELARVCEKQLSEKTNKKQANRVGADEGVASILKHHPAAAARVLELMLAHVASVHNAFVARQLCHAVLNVLAHDAAAKATVQRHRASIDTCRETVRDPRTRALCNNIMQRLTASR